MSERVLVAAALMPRLLDQGMTAEEASKLALEQASVLMGPCPGTCCTCGYFGPEETECPSREDRTHCEHWYDGPEAKGNDKCSSESSSE